MASTRVTGLRDFAKPTPVLLQPRTRATDARRQQSEALHHHSLIDESLFLLIILQPIFCR